jgi:hypothetical protein
MLGGSLEKTTDTAPNLQRGGGSSARNSLKDSGAITLASLPHMRVIEMTIAHPKPIVVSNTTIPVGAHLIC